MNNMKKGINWLFLIVLIIALLTVFYAFSQDNKKMTGNAIYVPPISNYCDNIDIAILWDSIFFESSTGITIYTNSSVENQCHFLAYKNKSKELYFIIGSNITNNYMHTIVFLAARGNLSTPYIINFINNASKITYQQPSENDVQIRNISSISQAVSIFNSIFKIDNSNWSLEHTGLDETYNYQFTNSNNISNTIISDFGIVSQNYSAEQFLYSNTFLLSCTSSWTQTNSSCDASETFISGYRDVNNCNIIPNSTYSNGTQYCDFDRNGIIGNKSEITRKNIALDILINGSILNDLQNISNATFLVEIKEGNITRIAFNHNFSVPLNLKNITVEKQSSSNNFGYLIVSGINLQKNITVDKLSTSSNRICIINSYTSNITQFSENCTNSGEYLLNCPGSGSGFTCEIQNNNSFYVSGLTSSAVKEMLLQSNQSNLCTSNWTCGDWTLCSAGQQTKTCQDVNVCDPENSTQISYQTCAVQCTPNWQCNNWTSCFRNNTQSRTCIDLNICPGATGKPSETNSCKYTNDFSVNKTKLAFYFIILSIISILSAVVLYLFRYLKKVDNPSNAKDTTEYQGYSRI